MSDQPLYSYPEYMDEPYLLDYENNVPIKKHRKQQLLITVLVFDKDEKCIREHKKDYRDKDHRKWLNTMLYWALSNGYSIEINS